jgi:serine phosphatase RsbU (regulator of sigma subunit)
MLMVQTAVRTIAVTGEINPINFLSEVNKIIYDNLQRINSYKNMTLLISHYRNGILTLCGQHEELLLVRNGGQSVERIDTMDLGFPLGLEQNIDTFLATQQIKLEVGDTVILYTDGISEAENEAGEFYGIERLCDQIIAHIKQPVELIHERIVENLHQYIGKQTIYDDITLMVIRRNTKLSAL